MKLLAICKSCGKRKLFIAKRAYKTVHAGTITSQNEICGTCKRNVKRMLKDEVK